MDTARLRQTVIKVILDRLSFEEARREEALADVLNLTVPGIEKDTAKDMAAVIPALPVSVYGRWAEMFADRLMETVPLEQVRDLCSDTDESRGTLVLVYLMFMESARMEKQVAEDLKALVADLADPGGAALALSVWLRHKMSAPAGKDN